MEIRIIKDNEIPAYTQISTHIHTLAQEGRLKPGTKLPSERELACTLSLSRGTVKKAYETLSEMGVIQISKKKKARSLQSLLKQIPTLLLKKTGKQKQNF